MRICSLVPSTTEVIFSLGLGDSLVGVTHECDCPPEAQRLPSVTQSLLDDADSSSRRIHNHVSHAIYTGSSLYALDQGLLCELNPDLIITQELCPVCAVSYGEVQKSARLLPGPRIIDGLEILAEILHPQLFSRRKPPQAWRRLRADTASRLTPLQPAPRPLGLG